MKATDLTPQYVTNDLGERIAVLIPIEQYEEMAELLEDAADAAEIERRRAERGIPHAEAMGLVKDGGAIPD